MESATERAGPPAMARAIETVLRQSAVLAEMRRAGLGIAVSGDAAGVMVETFSSGDAKLPTFHARVRSPGWWHGQDAGTEGRMAMRLANELLRKWEGWISAGSQ
jgi:hypothetical protein